MEFQTAKPIRPLHDGRLDIRFGCDARGMCLTSKSLAGTDFILSTDHAAYMAGVEQGNWFPLDLADKFPFVIRIVFGELTAAEQQEWVGRVTWRLSVPCGVLAVASGIEYMFSDLVDAYRDQYVEFVSVPSGDYQVCLYSYVTSVNALDCLAQAEGLNWRDVEKYGSWFRRSHPGREFPDWLKEFCLYDYDQDPGYQNTWQSFADTDEAEGIEDRWQERMWVDHLAHFEPLSGGLKMPHLRDGAFWYDECRRPEPCPQGIERAPGCIISE